MASSPVAPSAQAGRPPPRPRRAPVIAYLAAGAALVVCAGLLSYALVHGRQRGQAQLLRPSGIPASVSTPLANLMGLSALPGPVAPGFTLTDQAGRTISLASLRGHAVVLEFMDPHCTDICPLVSQEFIDAYHDLGAAASRAVFIAVNVNSYYPGVASVTAYSAEHQLTTIPSWHFFTGPLAALKAVWSAYDISVDAPSRNADVIHTSEVLFIAPSGQERYVAAPMADYTATGTAYLPAGQLAEWGQGIALVIRQLAR
jgi:cytochrome oxidase Cu insertion factor (SCO1/SenC/PrrC family)